VEIDAVYSPPAASAVQIVRVTTLVLTVTDFDLTVTPSYVESQRGTDKYATYTATLTAYNGLTALQGFQFTTSGLPEHTSWKLEVVSYKIDEDGKAVSMYNLKVKVESNVATGLFLFTMKVTAQTIGGSISHDVQNIQLKVV
jgi:hypothetical protein